MADDTSSVHHCREELEEYFLDVLTREESTAVELHLEACDACATLAMKIHGSWESLRDEMSPGALREAYWKDQLAKGWIAGAAGLAERVREELMDWLEISQGRAEGLVRIVKGVLNPVAQSAADLLLEGARFPALAPVPYRDPVVSRSGEESHSFVVLGAKDGPQAEVRLDGADLVVRFPGSGEQKTPPLVLVIPVSEPEKTRRVELRWNRTHVEWVGRLRVEQEETLVAIGPQL